MVERVIRLPERIRDRLSLEQFGLRTAAQPHPALLHVVEIEDDEGRKTGEKWLIFPRYHQVDAVRRLLAHARGHGPGQRYLVQHSAGSGKSFPLPGWRTVISAARRPGPARV